MKKVIIIFSLLIVVCSFISGSKKTLLEEFTVGKFSYCMYKEEAYLHDDNMNAEYFVVYGKNKKNSLCSSFMIAKRNDTIFTRGYYSFTTKKLVFKEYYYYQPQNQWTLDSLIKTFCPDKNGDLILKEAINFRNGKATKVK